MVAESGRLKYSQIVPPKMVKKRAHFIRFPPNFAT